MKILVVCQHYWPEPFQISEICESLVARGHTVTAVVGLPNYPTGVIPPEYRRGRRRREEINGVQVRRCFEIGRKNTKLGLAINYVSYMLSACWRVLWMKRDFDVIYAYSTSPVLMSLPAAFLRGFTRRKLMIYVLDIWPACLAAMNVGENTLLYRFMRRVSHWVYARADMLVYSSKRFRGYMREVHHIDMPESRYLPQFADDQLSGLPDKQPSDALELVFAGNIGRVQNVELIIDTAELLKELPVRWHILGDGARYEACAERVQTKGLTENVRMYGRRPRGEMPAFYAMADAMLVTMRDDISVNDTLPGKVQSYMAAGKPILGSITGETPEIIAEAECGLCAPPDDPAAFAEVVRAFMRMPGSERQGRNARAYYEKHFTKRDHMDALERMLKELAE